MAGSTGDEGLKQRRKFSDAAAMLFCVSRIDRTLPHPGPWNFGAGRVRRREERSVEDLTYFTASSSHRFGKTTAAAGTGHLRNRVPSPWHARRSTRSPIASQPREQAWPSSGPSRLHHKKPPTGKLTRPRPGNPGHGTELTRGFQWVRVATARIMDDSARVGTCPVLLSSLSPAEPPKAA